MQELRSFLGLINYYRRFIPHLSTILAPLNELLKAEHKWQWTKKCTTAVAKARKQLVKSPALIQYDPSLPIRLAADASSYGVGAVLSHVLPDGSEHPVAFASRTLTSAEKNYAQLEKEALAIIFGIKRFHQYLYGRKFCLITDHRPLTTILGPKDGTPPLAAARLQRWAMMSAYSYDIVFRKSEAHANADCLSRLPLSGNIDCNADVSSMFNIMQLSSLPLSHIQLKRGTQTDPTLSQVVQHTLRGWSDCRPTSEVLAPYWRHRHELTMEAGCLLLGSRVIVPLQWRQAILRELHEGHPGVARMKALARSKVWWPNIDMEIEKVAKSCSTCVEVKTSPAAPLHPWAWPKRPWS